MKKSSSQSNTVSTFLGHNKGFACIILGEMETGCQLKTAELTLADVQL